MSRELRMTRTSGGRRVVRLYLGTDRVTGRPVRPQITLPAGLTDEEARARATRWARRVCAAAGMGVTTRVGELMRAYVDAKEAEGAKPRTVDAYRRCCCYASALWDSEIGDVTPSDIESLYRSMSDAGYAASTLSLERTFLRGFWDHMEDIGACDTNPASRAGFGTGHRSRPEARALDQDQARALEADLAADAFSPCLGARGRGNRVNAFLSWLALNTGLRVGEACALRRQDFESDGPLLRVRGTIARDGSRQASTKGGRSRSVSLSAETASRIVAFEAWEASLFGRDPDSPLATKDGGWTRPDTLSRWLRRRAGRLGLPGWVRFHTLRHTHATLLLMSGMDPRTVSERLGHADVATTLRCYGHVLPGRDGEAARGFQRIMDGGESRGSRYRRTCTR